MKKTIIALLALGGIAMGADQYTFGSYVEKDGQKYDVISTFAGEAETTLETDYSVTLDKLHFTELTFSLIPSSMLASDTPASDSNLTLQSLTILGRTDDDYQATDTTMTLTIGDDSYSSGTAVYSDKGDGVYSTVTYTFETPVTFFLADTLSFSLTGADSSNRLGIAAIQGIEGAPIVYNSVWQMGVQLTATATTAAVPEPATATLSLLALAGLAARRRRK